MLLSRLFFLFIFASLVSTNALNRKEGITDAPVVPEPRQEPTTAEETPVIPEPRDSKISGRDGGDEVVCGDAPYLAGLTGSPDTAGADDAPLNIITKREASERIINGTNAPARGVFPFMVNIKTGWQHWCGGAVYDKYTVISAAHCFHNGQDLKLFFADWDQKKGYNYEIGQERRYVQKVIKHPEYDHYWQNNDIAILKLSEAVPFTDMIKPICMPTVEVKGGEDTIVMGWGYTYGTNNEDILNMAHVPIIPRETCRQKDWYSVAVNEHMICAGFEEGKVDACQGDSGGPLVLLNDATGRFELIGIVSWGSGCAKPKNPGVYTDVWDYIDWIKEVVGEPQY